jgi:hypothetical protein
MTRFAWLQTRTQTIIAFAGLLVVAAIALLTGPNLVHLYNTLIAPCTATDDCSGTTLNLFLQRHKELRGWLDILVIVLPGILGIFWGAPLVAREFESGTYRLAWSQSITRTRWLSIKIGVGLLISMTVAGLLSFVVSWWATPFDRIEEDAFGVFDQRDIVPIGYAALAFALAVAAGLLIRRTVPAMATALFTFVAIRIAMDHWVRPNLFTPKTLTADLDPTATGFGRRNSGPLTLEPEAPRLPNAWIRSIHIIDGNGHRLTSDALTSACPQLDVQPVLAPQGGGDRARVPIDVKEGLDACIAKLGTTYHRVVSYQPASRYWAFQWVELGIYVGAALLLAGLCVWSVRRRRA